MAPQVFDTAAILIMLAAGFGLFNHHILRLPFTIGLMLSALSASAAVLVLDSLAPGLRLVGPVREAVNAIDFHDTLMHGMLSFLLFAGALHVEMEDLLEHKISVLGLSSLSLLFSTAIVGFASYGVWELLGVSVPLPYCLVFGALISPTDPIAVLGIMKAAQAPRNLEIKVAGESLFNDGFAVVVFGALLAWAGAEGAGDAGAHGAGGGLGAAELVAFFLKEVGGGILLGLLSGYLVYRAMRRLDEPNLEILLSVALVMGVTYFAFQLHVSAPLACVVAGIFIGNRGRRLAMSERTRNALDVVWSFVDELLNAVLFLLVGLEIFAVDLARPYILAGLAIIPAGLAARWVSVWLPSSLFRMDREMAPGTLRVLTWGGLKGGISVALALSLPEFEGRDAILTATYSVVVFSILVQGLTMGRVIRSVVSPDPVPLL